MDRRTRILEQMRRITADHEARTAYEEKVLGTDDDFDSAGSLRGRRAECNRCGRNLAPMGHCFSCDAP
jgi:hypothetical protein